MSAGGHCDGRWEIHTRCNQHHRDTTVQGATNKVQPYNLANNLARCIMAGTQVQPEENTAMAEEPCFNPKNIACWTHRTLYSPTTKCNRTLGNVSKQIPNVS
eukprot:gene7144-250_t